LLGIAADEPERVQRLQDPELAVGYEATAFPLVEMGITRKDEGPILARWGLGHVQKSGCMLCKFQGPDWYWALSQVQPDLYAKVLVWEQASLNAAKRDGRPLADARILRGPKNLDERVNAWRAEHPYATIGEVFRHEYKSCQSRYKEPRDNPAAPASVCPYCGTRGLRP
jgi:hypothetical protein